MDDWDGWMLEILRCSLCNLAAGDPGQSRLQQEGLVLDVGNETHQLCYLSASSTTWRREWLISFRNREGIWRCRDTFTPELSAYVRFRIYVPATPDEFWGSEAALGMADMRLIR